MGIEIELHISPKNAERNSIREFGYDDSRSGPKVDERRKENLRSVYALIKTDLEEASHPAFVKDCLSGSEDYTKWAIEEDSSIMMKDKDTRTFNLLADECPMFRIFSL